MHEHDCNLGQRLGRSLTLRSFVLRFVSDVMVLRDGGIWPSVALGETGKTVLTSINPRCLLRLNNLRD